jgi:hypothetical protein
MKLLTVSNLSALALAALLAACGGPPETLPAQGAASFQSGSATTSVPVNASGVSSTAVSGTSAATMPLPDCAADGCNSPRIIDGNAEAFRYAAVQAAASATQS